ncbi:MAG: phosphoglucomutase/phosphomannomutase family protein, partial [Acidobacteria bacterium]|nr:phosphoglucomutase/phosphomannomutase family protein [Acidobacteriota bacterium]
SATPAIMKGIEAELHAGAVPRATAAPVTDADFKPAYLEAIARFVDLASIAQARFRFAHDAMYGAGRGMLAALFRPRGIELIEVRAEVNPLFPGINPEPIEPQIALLQEIVVREGCHAGFATDGDADRIGAVAEDGSFVDPHKIFSILLRWLLERKQWPGEVARTFSATGMLDRIAARYGRRLHETAIGFKYICDLMLERDILIGGEESGGIGLTRHLPERDGILNALMLASVMADEGKTLAELVESVQQEFGGHYYGRRDLHVAEEVKQATIGRACRGEMKRVGPYAVTRSQDVDGIKFFLDAPNPGQGAQAWLLMRASGTEPLLRLYAEAASPQLVDEILSEAEAIVRRSS